MTLQPVTPGGFVRWLAAQHWDGEEISEERAKELIANEGRDGVRCQQPYADGDEWFFDRENDDNQDWIVSVIEQARVVAGLNPSSVTIHSGHGDLTVAWPSGWVQDRVVACDPPHPDSYCLSDIVR